MRKILAEKHNFLLTENNGLYQFGSKSDFLSFWGVPVNQCGTKTEVIAELKRWRDGVDCNNAKMLEVENSFLQALGA